MSHRFSDIENFLESHKNSPKITQEPFLSSIIRSYGVAGMFDHALKIYHQMDDLAPPDQLFPSMCFYQLACTRNYIIVSPSFRSYCEMGLPEMAMERLKEMEEKGVESCYFHYYTAFILQERKSDEAKRVWNEMVNRGCGPDVGAYNVKIMNIQGGKSEGVKALIEEMSNAGLKPNTISYNYLMTCYCRNELSYRMLSDGRDEPELMEFELSLFRRPQLGFCKTANPMSSNSIRFTQVDVLFIAKRRMAP